EQWGLPTRQVDFYDVKNDVENLLGVLADDLVCVPAEHPALHPGRSAQLFLGKQAMGWLGELHPQWVQEAGLTHAPVLFEVDVDSIADIGLPEPREISRQPVVQRDLALWVANSVSYQSLLDT